MQAPAREAPKLACVKIGDIWWAPVNCRYDATHTYGSLNQWGRKYGNNTSGWTTDISGQNGFYFNGTGSCSSDTEGEKVFLPAAGVKEVTYKKRLRS